MAEPPAVHRSAVDGRAAARRPPAARALAGLALALLAGSLPYPVWIDESGGTMHLLAVEAVYGALVAAMLLHVRFVERRPWSSIGFWRLRARDAAVAVAFALLVIAGLAAIYLVVFPALGTGNGEAVDRLRAMPTWWLALSVIRAGVSEEILFRGYPIERLLELTGRRWIAAGLPLIPFVLAHVGPWGWSHVLVAAFGGAMLTWLYLLRRNLPASILAHCIVDAVGVFA
jgi:membrane protease YdiL (CAAX protease family)